MAGTNITIVGIEECLRAFQGLDKELRKNANGELRKASRQIASGIVQKIPGYAAGTGAPQAPAIAKAAGPKSDRYVVVAVPNKKPKMKGLKKTPAAKAKLIGWAVEGGSGYPPFHRPVAGSLVSSHREELAQYAIPLYTKAVADIMRKYDLI